MARDGRPGWPPGKSISSTTFRAMRLWTWARRIDRRSVLLIITSVRLLSTWPSSLKNLSASVAVKSLSFVAPILG